MGDIDLNTGESVPGSDSDKLIGDYGWEVLMNGSDTEYVLGAKTVEETPEMKYVFLIEVTDMAAACGGEDCSRSLWRHTLLPNNVYGSKEDGIKALLRLEDARTYAGAYFDEDAGNLGEDEIREWAEDHLEETELSLQVTELCLIPVSLTEKQAKTVIQDDDAFEHLQKSFKEHGDWRDASLDFKWHGHRVPIQTWEGWIEPGEWDEESIKKAKVFALQARMLIGFFLDRQVNQIGESGWDWLRNAGLFFVGDEVFWDRGHGEEWFEIMSIEDGTAYLGDRDGEEIEVPLDELRQPRWHERYRRKRDGAEETEAER